MAEIISDDLILSLEYYHDNPEQKKFVKKEKLFENIKYQNITLTNKKFKNEIVFLYTHNILFL